MNPSAARPRTQSSAAVSLDGVRWFLLNASPDVREQVGRLPSTGFPAAVRHVPLEGVLLTDTEIDHSLGIVLLREAQRLPLYATSAMHAVLERDSRFLPLARAFAEMPLRELAIDRPISLAYSDGTPSGLTVEAFVVPAGPPRFAQGAVPGHTVGLQIQEVASGHTCAYVPGCGHLDDRLRARLAQAEILLFDGTFWSDRELIDLGIGGRTARELDHLPIQGPGGSLAQLAALPCRHRVYTHINNTNPILLEDSPERALVDAAGITVGFDGFAINL